MSAPVKLTGSHTEAPQEQKAHAHDREDTGGTHSTCTHTNISHPALLETSTLKGSLGASFKNKNARSNFDVKVDLFAVMCQPL